MTVRGQVAVMWHGHVCKAVLDGRHLSIACVAQVGRALVAAHVRALHSRAYHVPWRTDTPSTFAHFCKVRRTCRRSMTWDSLQLSSPYIRVMREAASCKLHSRAACPRQSYYLNTYNVREKGYLWHTWPEAPYHSAIYTSKLRPNHCTPTGHQHYPVALQHGL